MLWLCIHCPKLALEALSVKPGPSKSGIDPSKPEPSIVTEQHRVYCCNQPASDAGIHPGQSTASAQTFHPGLHISLRDTAAENKALLNLALSCYRFTPAITLANENSLLLEIRSSLRLFKGLNHLLELLWEEIARHKITYLSGLADTPKAAQLMAFHSDVNEGFQSPPLQDSYDYINPETGKIKHRKAFEHLRGLTPLTHLDCPDALIKKLHRTGFQTLGEIYKLPMDALARRYGREFTAYLKRIAGTLKDPQCHITLPDVFQQDFEFDDALIKHDSILLVMQSMLVNLTVYLRGRQMYCQEFSWLLYQEPDFFRNDINNKPDNKDRFLKLDIRLTQAHWDMEHFLHLTSIQVEAIKLDAPLTAIRLQASRLYPAEYGERELLPPGIHCMDQQDEPASDHPVRTLIDALSARLNKLDQCQNKPHKGHIRSNNIYQISHHDSHIPEQASQKSALFSIKESCKSEGLRPGWLFPVPAPIQDRQQFLYWRGRLTLLQGPERIEGDWWRKPISRDYYLARHQNHALYWVYRDRYTQQWFVHGLFG